MRSSCGKREESVRGEARLRPGPRQMQHLPFPLPLGRLGGGLGLQLGPQEPRWPNRRRLNSTPARALTNIQAVFPILQLRTFRRTRLRPRASSAGKDRAILVRRKAASSPNPSSCRSIPAPPTGCECGNRTTDVPQITRAYVCLFEGGGPAGRRGKTGLVEPVVLEELVRRERVARLFLSALEIV